MCDQWRFWARVNCSKEGKDRISQICGSDGRVLVEEVKVRDQWKEHLRGCMGMQTDQVIRHYTGRLHWKLKVNWKKMRVMRVARQKGHCEVRIGVMEIE